MSKPTLARDGRADKQERIYVALEEVRAKNPEGLLTAAEVVEAARSPESVLHDHFTWDDAKAAEEWRLEEGRRLIRTVYVEIQERRVPAYVSLVPDRAREDGGYRNTREMTSDEFVRELERTARGELQSWQRRHDRLVNVAKLLREMAEELEAA